MTNEDFVNAVRVAVAEGAVSGLIDELKQPIGRRPSPEAISEAAWFNALSDDDKSMISDVVAKAVNRAIFGFFSVLDNVRSIEGHGPKGELELFFVKDGQKDFLNSPNQEKLHEIYKRK